MIPMKLAVLSFFARTMGIAFKVNGLPYGAARPAENWESYPK